MNAKQKWLLERLLLPVGFIPNTINLQDFHYYEATRQKIKNIGFEYFYMMGQDMDAVNETVLHGKIHALHAPWNSFPPIDNLPKPLWSIADFLILRNRHFPEDLIERTKMALEFAHKTGAKVVISHISFFDHYQIKQQLQSFAALEEKFKISIAIEHDAPYIYEQIKKGHYYLPIDGNYDWMIDPAKMSKTLRNILPQKQFGLCFDSASLIMSSLPLVETIKPIIDHVIHLHLASNKVGVKDEAREIDTPEIIDLVNFVFRSNYSKYITAEVNGAIGEKENLLAKIHTALAICKCDILRQTVLLNAQKHLSNSCNYLLDGLK